jgi:hypothetical protein
VAASLIDHGEFPLGNSLDDPPLLHPPTATIIAPRTKKYLFMAIISTQQLACPG